MVPPKERSTVLVIGGTGMLGRPVVEELVAHGFRVRVLSRQSRQHTDNDESRVEFLQGNVQDETSLQSAMSECVGVHLNLSGGALEREGAEAVARLSSRIPSLKRVTLISGISTSKESAEKFESARAKWDAEQALIQSCEEQSTPLITYTIFRCTIFLETLPKWRFIIGEQNTKWQWLAARDYARMVAYSYSRMQSTSNQIFFITGQSPPRTLKQAINDVYLPKLKRSAHFKDEAVPTVTFLPRWLAWMLHIWPPNNHSRQEWDALIARMQWLSEIDEGAASDEVSESAYLTLGGPPRISMEQWIDQCIQEQKTRYLHR